MYYTLKEEEEKKKSRSKIPTRVLPYVAPDPPRTTISKDCAPEIHTCSYVVTKPTVSKRVKTTPTQQYGLSPDWRRNLSTLTPTCRTVCDRLTADHAYLKVHQLLRFVAEPYHVIQPRGARYRKLHVLSPAWCLHKTNLFIIILIIIIFF